MSLSSKPVTSNQTGVHEDLVQVVKKHTCRPFKKPYRSFSADVFQRLDDICKQINKPIILDSGCGTGESSFYLAKSHPDKLVIGIDKSGKRLVRYLQEQEIFVKDNLLLARADVVDIWRMAAATKWNISRHYLLYPNPWPKKDHLKRRWHAHPVFPEMYSLCHNIELRTNWKIYAEEFRLSLELVGEKKPALEELKLREYCSPFEKKYVASRHSIFKVST